MRTLILTAILYGLSLGVANAQTCNGVAATIVGTPGDDDIEGTAGNDVIAGLAGNDRIVGGDGDDLICGDDGDDDLLGDAGADQLLGNAGNDVMEGGADTDVCDGVTGIDSAGLDCETTMNVDTAVVPVTLFADDGVPLDGALYLPTGDAVAGGGIRKVAMIVSHGAMGSFANSIPKIIGLQAAPLGFAVLALNRRDWGPDSGGGAVLFEDATLDLGVGIDLLTALGFELIYVGGHSQGTQNGAIYPSFSLDEHVAAVGLYGTVDDGRRTATDVLFSFPPDLYDQHVASAEDLVAAGQGNIVVPWSTVFGVDLFRTPNNFLSYWGPDTLSVVEREITKLEVAALLLRAEGDNFTPDEMSQNVLESALAAGVDATYTVLDYPFPLTDNGGNAHGFVGVERETIQTTVDWLESRVPEAQEFAADLNIPAENPPGNFEPIADAGAPVQATANTTVQLDGSNSLDLDGTIVSYFWTQTSGQPATLNAASTAQPSVEVPLAATALEFELTVTDDDGASTNDRVEIDVTDNAQLPGSSSSIDLLTLLTLLLTICLAHRKRASARLSQGKS